MAGPLTWRNVDAPDASVAMQGLRQMSDSLRQAFSGGATALGDFKEQRAAGADQAALSESLKFTDPAKYQAALQAGLIQQPNMSAAGTAALGNRATQLLTQAGLGQDQQIGEQNLLKGNQALAAGDQLYAQRNVAADNLARSTSRAIIQEGRDDVNYADTKAADALRRQIIEQGANDPQTIKSLLAAARPGMSEGAYNKVSDSFAALNLNGVAAAQQQYDTMGNVIPGTEASPSGAGQYLDAQFQAESDGNQFDPKTGKTLTSPAGAMGIAQIMPATGPDAARAAGLPYSEERLRSDPEYNKTLGTAYSNMLFKRYDNDPHLALAAYNAGMGNVDAAIAKVGDPRVTGNYDAFLAALPKPSETTPYVKGIIENSAGKQPVAADPVSEPVSAAEVQQALAVGDAKLDATDYNGRAAQMIAAKGNDNTDIHVVAKNITKQIGHNANEEDVLESLREIQTGTGRNASVAGEIFLASLKPSEWWSTDGGRNVSDAEASDQTLVDSLVKASNSGKDIQNSIAYQNAKIGLTKVPELQADLAAKNKRMNEAMALAGQPGYTPALIARYRADANRANTLLRKAVDAVNKRPQ